MIPLVTLVGLTNPDLFGGALNVENVFAYPVSDSSPSTRSTKAITQVAMAAVMILALLTVLGNLSPMSFTA